MRVEKKDASQERRILIGMIVDNTVCGKISASWEKEMFETKWCNLIGNWSVKFYKKYGKAPGKSIQGLFESWANNTQQDKEIIKLVEGFLESLSNEYQQLAKSSNSEYTLDLASEYFEKIKVIQLIERLQGDVDSGEVKKAIEKAKTFSSVELIGDPIKDLFVDPILLPKLYTRPRKGLIAYPGALAAFYGDCLQRDSFVAYMGPEKRGKSFLLLDAAYRAACQGRRVLFLQVGDMSEDQVVQRFVTRAARRPFKACTIDYPTYIEFNPRDGYAEVTLTQKTYKNPLSQEKAIASFKELVAKKNPALKIGAYGGGTISVFGIQSVIQELWRKDWPPDIVVLDYADNLAPPHGIVESRDQINATWLHLRTISQQFHCCLITATQSDAASYDAYLLTRKHFTNDKRKYAHVTAMFGINVHGPEKERGITRLNHLMLREDKFTEDKCVHVAGCLALANPAVLSCF